jgi:hypothetical protein
MPMGVLFWMLMILWLLLGFWWHSPEFKEGKYGIFGGNLLLFVLLGLLGWKVSCSDNTAGPKGRTP